MVARVSSEEETHDSEGSSNDFEDKSESTISEEEDTDTQDDEFTSYRTEKFVRRVFGYRTLEQRVSEWTLGHGYLF